MAAVVCSQTAPVVVASLERDGCSWGGNPDIDRMDAGYVNDPSSNVRVDRNNAAFDLIKGCYSSSDNDFDAADDVVGIEHALINNTSPPRAGGGNYNKSTPLSASQPPSFNGPPNLSDDSDNELFVSPNHDTSFHQAQVTKSNDDINLRSCFPKVGIDGRVLNKDRKSRKKHPMCRAIAILRARVMIIKQIGSTKLSLATRLLPKRSATCAMILLIVIKITLLS